MVQVALVVLALLQEALVAIQQFKLAELALELSQPQLEAVEAVLAMLEMLQQTLLVVMVVLILRHLVLAHLVALRIGLLSLYVA